MKLVTCGSCGLHHFAGEEICPHCATKKKYIQLSSMQTPSALLLGLTISGCAGMIGEAEYGVAVVMTDLDGDEFYQADDCDDENADINPNAEEICDDVDNDCDGLIDEDDPDLVSDTGCGA